MTFAPVAFTPPAAVRDVAGDLAGPLADLSSLLARGADNLQGLGLPGSGSGDQAAVLAALRARAAGALSDPAGFLALTPDRYGVGARKGEYGYLTPATALQTLAARFAESGGQSHGQDEHALVVLLIATQSPAGLGQALSAFARVYPVPELEQACRRARALAALERDKFVTPAPEPWPDWSAAAAHKHATGRAMAAQLGALLAAGEGAAGADRSPADLLAAFARKQAEKLEMRAENLQSLCASMSGSMDAWNGVYVQGAGAALYRFLSQLPPPVDESFKSTALVCWYGTPGQTAYYRQAFGLCPRRAAEPVCQACAGSNPQCPF